jgi:50S ribosomal protein L16 3-hydroxylase
LNSRKRQAGLDPAVFMERHWQREPLLVRGAFPGFADPLAPREVLALARSGEAASRLVRRRARHWSLEHGPFEARTLAALPGRDWTVLVQDTNHFSPAADALLAAFDFLPHARIDDVMVSYAVPGGGVGPHVDSYDVFLLQGRGRRRWRISRQRDLGFVPGLPLKILADFRAEEEWVLGPGDMLYLPPGVAHDGVAESECLTWSIGFRAPTDEELARAFLGHLDDALRLDGQYADAGTRPARHPGELPADFLAHATRVAGRIRWNQRTLRDFCGRFLSEPKPQVFFKPPPRPLAPAAFRRAAVRRGLALDPRSRLLFSGTMFFMNGEAFASSAAARSLLRRLADRRAVEGLAHAPADFWALAHEWYRCGYLALGGAG